MKKKSENVIWETITVRMTQEEKETLRKIAEEEDLTLTIYVKRLLRREIRSKSLKPGPGTEPYGGITFDIPGFNPLSHPDSSGGAP
jgi:hypothetical protein